MRIFLVVILLCLGAFVFVLAFVPRPHSRDRPDLLRSPAAQASVQRGSRDRPLDLSQTYGEHIYKPQRGTVVIDGETIVYPAFLMWCGEVSPLPDDRFEFKDLRVVMNEKPKTREDLEQICRLPDDVHPTVAGELISKLLAEGRAGVHAGRAIFHGGREFSSADRVDLSENVSATLTPTKKGHAQRMTLRAPDLKVMLEGGQIATAETQSAVSVIHAQATLQGVGLLADLRTGSLRLDRDIDLELEDLTLLGKRGPKARLRAQGPLTYEPTVVSEQGSKKLPDAGVIVVLGDVTLDQGEFLLRGDRLDVIVRQDPIREIQRLTLEGSVSLSSNRAAFQGDVVTYEPERPEHQQGARLVLEGSPTRAILKKAAGMLPGADPSDDVLMETPGRVVFPLVGEELLRRIDIGPDVTLTAPEARVAGMDLVVFLQRVPDVRSHKGAGTSEFPTRIELRGNVSGRSPSGTLAGEFLSYDRVFDTAGRPIKDIVALRGNPNLSYVITQTAKELAPSEIGVQVTKPRGALDLAAPGEVLVFARDSIVVERDPLRIQPLEARARGAVVLRKVGQTPQAQEARLEADELDLVIDEVWEPVTGSPRRAGVPFLTRREVRHFVARGRVLAKASDRYEGRGHQATYAGAQGDLEILGNEEGPAHLAFADPKGRRQTVTAERMHYLGTLEQITASGRVIAKVFLPELDYRRAPNQPVVTHETLVRANRVVVEFRAGTSGPKGPSVREILADSGVEAHQEIGSSAHCHYLRFDVVHGDLEAKGEPAKLVMFRTLERQTIREEIVAPMITISQDRALLKGPLSAMFFAAPTQLPMNLGRSPVAQVTPQGRSGLVPVTVTAEKDAFLSRERILLRGPARVQQSDPRTDGFALDASRIFLFLTPGVSQSLEVARAVAEEQVVFTSRDLVGSGDLMTFDNTRKLISLKGQSRLANLIWRGSRQMPQPGFELNYSDPRYPRIIVVQTPVAGQHR